MTTPLSAFPCRRYLRHGMFPQLVVFEAVVRLGSATRAAETLCMAQPTVSGHLRKLSEALGVRLFTMHGKHLVPTDAATALLHAAREVFATLERCERVLVNLRGRSRMDACLGDLPFAGADSSADTDWFNDLRASTIAGKTRPLHAQRSAAPVT